MKTPIRHQVAGEESGFTLIEVLVTMTLMLVVLFALYSIFDMGLRVYSFGNDKVEAVENARLGMESMERELRAAYPVDPINGDDHVFFAPGTPGTSYSSTATEPEEDSITFGNDLQDGGTPPNRMIDAVEEITYELRSSSDLTASCSTASDAPCTLVRRQGVDGSFEPVVEYVVPGGLEFTGYRNRGALAGEGLAAADNPAGTDIAVVRVELTVEKDRGSQTLVTDVDLRNRG